MASETWPGFAVVGAGAVGCYYGGMLAHAGAPVTLIGRAQHVDAINRDGLFLDGIRVKERIKVAASTELAAVKGAQVVLVCVKTTDTEETARQLVPLLREARVISLQNGVDNVERMRTAAGLEAIAAAVYVAAEMTGPGHVRQTSRGDLVIGAASGLADPATAEALAGLAALFNRADIPCKVTQDIRTALWAKLVLNCTYNAISALARARYGRIVRDPEMRTLLTRVVEETVAVARAAGVQLDVAEQVAAGIKLGDVMPEALSSTAQDIARGKHTEIDSLNGYVVRLGEKLGVATPINYTLYKLVKLLEEAA
ncbi:MAG TPA: ketopantoate reductase family protein [Steroidobacteraceae bacterium]|nr:ketopantoate reductase family protein [Steroidobacteraceae bacterium]